MTVLLGSQFFKFFFNRNKEIEREGGDREGQRKKYEQWCFTAHEGSFLTGEG